MAALNIIAIVAMAFASLLLRRAAREIIAQSRLAPGFECRGADGEQGRMRHDGVRIDLDLD